MWKLRRRGPYVGRLAFDGDTGFHLAENGRKVVTDDDGKTWRYATAADLSHNARYQRNAVTVDSTANELARLTLVHGPVDAAALVSPHHYEVQTDDGHYDLSAPALTRTKQHPDEAAATVTSHTEAHP